MAEAGWYTAVTRQCLRPSRVAGHDVGSRTQCFVPPLDLDGIVSCSVVSDADLVTRDFDDTGLIKHSLIPEQEFWASEYTAGRKPPQNLQDLVIYELHVGSLGYPSTAAGTFADAMARDASRRMSAAWAVL